MAQKGIFPALSMQELQQNEKAFINYLAVNGIDAPEWEEIKKSDPNKTNTLILDFSQAVWKSRLEKLQFINLFQNNRLSAFNFEKDSLTIVGLTGDIDFESWKGLNWADTIEQIKSKQKELSIFKRTTDYKSDREGMIFSYLSVGGLISEDGALFNLLNELQNGK